MTYPEAGSLEKLTLSVHGPGTALAQLPRIHDLYAQLYAESSDWIRDREVHKFISSWPKRYGAPNFCLVTADIGDEVIGFAFGHALGESTRWWEGALEEFPQDVVAEWHGRTFAIIEIAVQENYRKQGVARRLHTHLTAELSAERVTLLVEPDNDAALQAYLNWGYNAVGRIQPFSDGPVFQAMIKTLRR